MRSAECGNLRVTRFKKILLSQMAKVCANLRRDIQMVVDDEPNFRAASDGQNLFRHAPDFIGRRIFGAQLNQVAAAVTELLRDKFGRAAMQVSRVHEGVKFALAERFHDFSLAESARAFKRHPPEPVAAGGQRGERVLQRWREDEPL